MDDKRLIEDYLPIVAISAEASREKSVRKGHISTLHLWWARRPLVACRAAVYGALVPASQFVPNGGTDAQKKSLGRANAARFITSLCQYPGSPQVIKEAQAHILKAHAERLSTEHGKPVTVEDILAGRAPRPRVLDMFAGGGAIPLEALRLGCEAYALDLNPVAHIIQLCTLVYPQKFGKPDPTARGMTGPNNDKGESTWGGLVDEVRHWGKWVLEKVRVEIGDLYPPIPDPEFHGRKKAQETQKGEKAADGSPSPGGEGRGEGGRSSDPFAESQHVMGFADDPQQRLKPRAGFLTPVAYLWTRTVQCKNPACGATVPLLKQTWLCKKEGRYVALKIIAPQGEKRVRFEVVEARNATALGFDPGAFSKAGNATCPFCGTVADSSYVHDEGRQHRIGLQLMSAAVVNGKRSGRRYLSGDVLSIGAPERVKALLAKLADEGIAAPTERIPPPGNAGAATGISFLYGMETFADIFAPRQLAALLSFVAALRHARKTMLAERIGAEHGDCLATYLALSVSRLTNQNNTLCVYHTGRETVEGSLGRKRLIYSWDFPETNPITKTSGSFENSLDWIVAVVGGLSDVSNSATVQRGSALCLPFTQSCFDAVVSDPPYYDNIGYSELSDLFYVWLKRMLHDVFPEHLSGELTPKKEEAVAAAYRQGGTQELAKAAYQKMMLQAFKEASRVLKPGCPMVTIYAHKTTSGWSTLVDALREANFEVVEAWPLDTELQTGVTKQDMAMLSSSISMVTRKRTNTAVGSYEDAVKHELEAIVRERVETLWDMGISGADLVIASVGAGLRAFTRFARVEYANGEEVPAERFLTEVETVVLETILARLSRETELAAKKRKSRKKEEDGGEAEGESEVVSFAPSAPFRGKSYSLSGLDAATRFYILWRYTYGAAELDAGEAIIFANGTHVELDGQHGLTGGNDALVEKKKSKYRLRDFTERGDDGDLGLPDKEGNTRPTIDALHRLLWLLEHKPPKIPEFLGDAGVSTEQLRLVAQALAGPALKGGELADISPTAEQSALGKLLSNWQAVVEGKAVVTDRQKGQQRFL